MFFSFFVVVARLSIGENPCGWTAVNNVVACTGEHSPLHDALGLADRGSYQDRILG